MNIKIILTCKSIWYHSPLDEDVFFEWINKIPSVVKYDGRLNELYLYVENDIISDNDLRELLALFYRYKVNMKQLAIFLNDSNRSWFYEGHKGYWYDKVFGLL